jgi:hypothetical protein
MIWTQTMKVGDLVRYRNSMHGGYGIVLEHGDYAFACDIFIYWFRSQHARSERSGDLTLLTFS